MLCAKIEVEAIKLRFRIHYLIILMICTKIKTKIYRKLRETI